MAVIPKPTNTSHIYSYISHKIALNSSYGSIFNGPPRLGKSQMMQALASYWAEVKPLRVLLDGKLILVNLDGRTKWDLIKWCRQRFGYQDTKMKRKGWKYSSERNELLLPENKDLTEFKLTWL